MITENLDLLLEYCKENNRICPQPQLRNILCNKLKEKKVGAGWNPPLPLILAAGWEASPISKQERLKQHLIWAYNHGQLKEIVEFLNSLSENQWFHGTD